MPDQATTVQDNAVSMRAGGCAGCTLCCKVMSVPALDKPAGTWCPHCKKDTGCGIYQTRPEACANFICGFLSTPSLGEEWRPIKSRLVINTQKEADTTLVFVDQARPDAWRRQPYYAALQGWARTALANRRRVIVITGARTIMIMPDHAVDFGAVYRDEILVVFPVPRADGKGTDYRAYAAKAEVWARLGPEMQRGMLAPTAADGFRAGVRVE